ncbi:MAG: Ribosomal protein S18 acetylase RimI [Thermodesulfobacterium sp.]|uniref:Ribosomal protein S18 acetylase RimI n=1 Tax=Candidatus Thermodesulfobacterium syntrophicum TaxID=3060442 RepID=A0AAE3P2I6_9BACT|nr:Ribosomal protein S18 acetylase RimI [Candidatus Thermodesulfobacterium syntrophicum]
MKIRQVKLNDINEFIEIYIKAYEELENYKYKTRKEIKNYFKWLYKRDKEGFIVAEENNKSVGFAAGDANWINFEGEKVLEIHEIFVLPEFRKKGVGSKLLNEILSYGIKKRRRLAELWVGKTNYTAIGFYKYFGFKEAGEWGKWLRMIKSLNS